MTPAEQAARARQQARYAAEDAVRSLTVGNDKLARQSLRDALNLLAAADRYGVQDEPIPVDVTLCDQPGCNEPATRITTVQGRNTGWKTWYSCDAHAGVLNG